MKIIKMLLTLSFLFLVSACINRGTQLSQQHINSITRGVTTEQQIRAMFGEPVGVEVNQKAGTRTLYYGYENDDSIKKGAAATGGAIAGGVLGSNIGGGSGSVIAGSLGTLVGGLLAENMVTAREEKQKLVVIIDLRSGRVKDFNYIETKGRSQAWGVNSGVGTL